MTVRDIDDLAGDKILYAAEVEARIADLAGASREDYADDASCESGEGERAVLEEFRAAVVSLWGQDAWDRGLSLVADSYWAEYADADAVDVYGSAAETMWWKHRKYARDLQREFTQVEFNHAKFWGDGS